MSEQHTIFQAISAIMEDVSAIGKDKRNEQQGFRFRGIDDVYNSLHPLMAKHRVFSVPEVLSRDSTTEITAKGNKLFYEKLIIQYTFYSEDGSSVKAVVCGVGMDSGDKAANKAMAIGHKYALLQVFCVPTVDMEDPDSNTAPESVATPRRETATPRSAPAPAPTTPKPTAPERPPLPFEPGGSAYRVPEEQLTIPSTRHVNSAIQTINEQKFLLINRELKKRKVDPGQWSLWLATCYGWASAKHIRDEAFDGIMDTIVKHTKQITEFKAPGTKN